MFSSKKKPERPRRNHGGNLSQYGLFDIPTDVGYDEAGEGGLEEDDEDLEAELAALTAGGGTRPKRPARKQVTPAANLDVMVQESMKDIPSDEDGSVDENDPDLLSELTEITGGAPEPTPDASPVKESPPTNVKTLLQERLKMYELAESNAKTAGETSRARRFNRGIKTIKDLLKQENAGRPINNEDIPPEVTVNVQNKEPSEIQQPSRPAPAPPVEEAAAVQPPEPEASSEISPENKELLELLTARRDQYKMAALQAKKSGDAATAVSYVKIAKQFEVVMKAVENGQPVDLSRMPGPPVQEEAPVETSETQNHEAASTENEEEIEVEVKLISAGSVLEALEQRLDVYKKQEASAKEEGNGSKARRMGRIVKQFEQAVKAHKSGKTVAFDELPTPPGYAPIPGTEKPAEAPPEAPPAVTPAPPIPVRPAKPSPPPRSGRSSGNHVPTTRMEKQITLLQERQKEFKEAALEAKKKGEMAEAKEFLRTSKGFDPLIEAAMGGLPVDISSLPIPPSAKSQLDNEYDLVMAEECTEDDTGVLDVITRLEQQLTKQLKMCLTTRDHHKALGDVAGMNRFEHLALSVTKDLDLVRIAKRNFGCTVPKFHYEVRDFSIVKSFTDLNDNDLELSIVRGINYNCANPKDVDTFVKFEFPFPQEDPLRDRTVTVKDTNNPEYSSTFTIPIQRTARPCLRVFKRHAVKFEVYSKGGFFRGDTLMGTVNVKLQPLETQCELHDSYDLLDGRKKVGGKLEVRLRVRDPLINREVQKLSERWLVIDH